MDYETADGSQFSLREEWTSEGNSHGTLITAFVEGNAYVGRSAQRMDDLNDFDVLQLLEPIPYENIFPLFAQGLTKAPPFDPNEHYLKAPQFAYEDREPGRTFVADRMRSEIEVLEHLSKQRHPSIVAYYGCVVKEDRITHICLQRCHCNLVEYLDSGQSEAQCEMLLKQIECGIEHLHSLGIAHNDINPDNICVDERGNAVIIDFDSALPFGNRLLKGRAAKTDAISHRDNDYRGVSVIEDFLKSSRQDSELDDED